MKIGRIEPVPIRELWTHEEHGFSVWLENNIDVLSDALGFRLDVVEREKYVGSFKVDLVAEDEAGSIVIIENQLEPTDHDHLGKVLTYATNLESKIAVWISTSPRPEHVRAINWLNESTPVDVAFFLVKVDGYRIEGSPPAPLFSVVVGPSEDSKAIGREKKELAERHVIRLAFWDQLLKRAAERGVKYHINRSPTKEGWISAGAGKSGLSWTYVVWVDGTAAVELYIDTGDKGENKAIFDRIHEHRPQVEVMFGGHLEWERLDEKKACRIRHTLELGGLKAPEEEWPAIQAGMIDAMDRLVKALEPHVA